MSISYEQYFELREHPFSITPDPRFVYLSDIHREALEHLNYGAAGGGNGFVLLTGEVGTGKTTICRAFLEQLPPKTEVILILNPVLTLNEFLQTICDELDLVIEGSRESNKNLIDHFNRFLLQVYAVGQKTILIVDEAQNLSHELLEQIRLLTNLESNTDKLLQIFLIGQSDLRDMLRRPDLLQVSQRITSRYHLGPLNMAQTGEYIQKRLSVAGTSDIRFTSSALRRIYKYTKGIPRLINILCDKALLSAYQRSTHKIDGSVVRDAERRLVGTNHRDRGGLVKQAAVGLGLAGVLAALWVGANAVFKLPELRIWLDSGMAAVSSPTRDTVVATADADAERPAAQTPISAVTAVDGAAPQEGAAPERSDERFEGARDATAQAAFGREAALQAAADPRPLSAPQTDQRAAATPEPLSSDEPASTAGPETFESASVAVRTERSPAPDKVARIGRAAPLSGTAPVKAETDTGSRGEPRHESLASYTRSHAERKLLAMWGVTDTQLTGPNFCRDVVRHNLQCLSEAGGLQALLRYNRPAILYLKISKVAAYAVMVSASREGVVLDVLGREHAIPASSLRDVWDGKFLLLWQPFGEFTGNIALGTQGQGAAWVRRVLDELEGTSTTGDVYDEQLAARVRQFQRRVGLAPDGIVGPRTLIVLQNKLAERRG